MNPLFYKNVTLLEKKRHKDWWVEPLGDLSYAAATNSIFLLAGEFVKAAKEYPIIFAKDGESVFCAALVGLRDSENLFVQTEGAHKGKWDGAYVPAYVRRYPFIPASRSDRGELTVCIDESFAGFNQDGRGDRLFEEDGRPGVILEKSISFLQNYQSQHQRTLEFCEVVKNLDLLEPMNAEVEMKSGDKFSLSGFFTVDRKKLVGLTDKQLVPLFKKGDLELIHAHLLSLDNFGKLMAKM